MYIDCPICEKEGCPDCNCDCRDCTPETCSDAAICRIEVDYTGSWPEVMAHDCLHAIEEIEDVLADIMLENMTSSDMRTWRYMNVAR